MKENIATQKEILARPDLRTDKRWKRNLFNDGTLMMFNLDGKTHTMIVNPFGDKKKIKKETDASTNADESARPSVEPPSLRTSDQPSEKEAPKKSEKLAAVDHRSRALRGDIGPHNGYKVVPQENQELIVERVHHLRQSMEEAQRSARESST